MIEERSKSNTLKIASEIIHKSNRLKENENDLSCLLSAKAESSQKDDCFLKNMTNNQISIDNRKVSTKYSDTEELLDVENLSDDENKSRSSISDDVNSDDDEDHIKSEGAVELNLSSLRTRSRNSSSKCSSRSLSNSTTNSNLNSDSPRNRNSSSSSSISSNVSAFNKALEKEKPRIASVILGKRKKNFKRFQRTKSSAHKLNVSNLNACGVQKKISNSIVINGKRYYRKFRNK